MQATVLAKEFGDVVKELARVTPKRSSLPITGELLLEHHGATEVLTVTATDLETAVTRTLGSPGGEAGQATVPAAALAKMLPAFGERVTLKTETNGRVSFSEGERRATLSGADPEDYPPVPGGQEHLLTVDAEDFRRALDRATYCALRDDSRPILNGALLEVSTDPGRALARATSGTLTIVGSDGFRLARQQVPAEVSEGPLDRTGEARRVLPLSALVHLRRFLARSMKTFSVAVSATAVEVTDGHGGRLVAQTIQGTFPNYDQLIPKHDQLVTFERDAFRSELKALAPIVNESGGIVRLTIDADTVRLEGKAEAFGEYEGRIEPAGLGSCHGLSQIAFNHRLLSDLMDHMGETVTLHFGASDKPGLWTDEDDGFFCILMPMMVAW